MLSKIKGSLFINKKKIFLGFGMILLVGSLGLKTLADSLFTWGGEGNIKKN